MGPQYAAAATTWNQLFREFLYAEEQAAAATAARAEAEAGAPSGAGQRVWRCGADRGLWALCKGCREPGFRCARGG